jgi:hypothetical protein
VSPDGHSYLLAHIGELKADLRKARAQARAQRLRAEHWIRRCEQMGAKVGRARRSMR